MLIQNSKLKSQKCCAPAARYYNIAVRYISFAFCVLSLALAVFGGGCARTVTQLVTYGDQMVVEITLEGNMNADANRYFLVLSDNPNYKIPLPPPDILEDAPEFIEPGTIPIGGSEEAYYTNFFSTWSGYIIIDPAGYSLAKGPFVIGQTPTREVLGSLGESGNKISFSFRLGRIFDAVPGQVYFDFAAVPWPDGEMKIPYDHLPTTDNYISKISGSIATVSDDADSELEPDLDILGCRVEIQ